MASFIIRGWLLPCPLGSRKFKYTMYKHLEKVGAALAAMSFCFAAEACPELDEVAAPANGISIFSKPPYLFFCNPSSPFINRSAETLRRSLRWLTPDSRA